MATPLVSEIEVARPPEEVYAYATDPTRFPEWQDDVVEVRLAGDGPPAVGSRFVTSRRMGRGPRTMTQEVTELDAPRRWAARGVDGAFRPHATVTVEPIDGGSRSRVTFTLDFEGRGFGDLLVPVIRKMAAKTAPTSYRHLKERLEGRDDAKRAP
ncbi:SRPBCC family protein [Streptomyces odontomachi]|uniref:SRPBCC family protein n=1 Tax=Streptomyces odontomachi TaxID=2944940 RepID=UPI00210C0E9E|nr:SRPBCC family protein [Streptomyces sp. ODS25]